MRAAMELRTGAGAPDKSRESGSTDGAPDWGASCVGERLVARSRLAAAVHQLHAARAASAAGHEGEAYDAALPSNPPVRRARSESLL